MASLFTFPLSFLITGLPRRVFSGASSVLARTVSWCLYGLLISSAPTVLAADAVLQTLLDQVYTAEPQDQALQSLDLYWKEGTEKKPVILYIHGGGWVFGDKNEVLQKPDFFTDNDFAFVSMNYRLRWDYTLYDQLEDVVSAIGWIRDHSESHGLDSRRIILMGHGAGGHLASLIATDPGYLATANLKTTDIKAVVTIDTFSFDIPRVMTELGNFLQRRQHELIFGDSDKIWQASSPITHLKSGRKVPLFVLIYPVENVETSLQTQAFARDLVKLGNTAIMIPGPEGAGSTLDANLGKPNDPATRAMMTFLRVAL